MKLTKLSIFAILALGGLMAIAPIADAQDSSTPPQTPPAGGAPGGGRMRRGNLQAMLAKLDLTDDEKAKTDPIVKDQTSKLKDLRADTTLSQEDRRAKMKDIMENTMSQLKPILTADQYTKLQGMMNARRQKPGTPGAAPTSPPSTGTNTN